METDTSSVKIKKSNFSQVTNMLKEGLNFPKLQNSGESAG